jgi:alanyl-tRNA synthetase
VEQRGSHINAERLRFDFSHPARVTPEELSRVEELVNGAIGRDFPIDWTEMSPEEARRNGAIGLFTDRYGERVKVYAIGNMEGTPEGDPNAETFSKEVCGGPHVERTGLLGRFRVVKEQSASSGVRRIRGVLK